MGRGQERVADDTLTTVSERMADQLGKGIYECMICLNKIARHAPIWSCDKCSAAFHLDCVHKWIKRSNSGNVVGHDFEWQCPGCRYHRVSPLPQYVCFCTKMLQPEASPHWLAHTCGEPCERNRGCSHPCPLLCHPGPCPPCMAVGPPGACHCGRESRETTRCGDSKSWSCGETCGKELHCGRHTCPVKCHPGPCPPCVITSPVSCYCGKETQDRSCFEEEFSCAQACGRLLDCGAHWCERQCHDGECGPCLRDPATVGDKCACGQTSRCQGEAAAAFLVRWVGTRKKCTDPLPLCGQKCGRLRSCGHTCKRTCHEGACGPCDELVQRECRCGQKVREVVCSETIVRCQQVCKTRKTCGNHRCDVVCCEAFGKARDDVHMCLQTCGRPLACGKHVCEDFCHLGRCSPCRVLSYEPLTCACGDQSIPPPVSCGTAPPLCRNPCGAELPCGHQCLSTCHHGDHPACQELVGKLCAGGHREMLNQRCHARPISCGQKCGVKLECGHSCGAQCHAGDCPPCNQKCSAVRVHCEHRCEQPCHPGSPCQDLACSRKVKAACACGQRVDTRFCGAFSGTSRQQVGFLKCVSATCERRTRRRSPRRSGDADRYAVDLRQMASSHIRYVQVLEDRFEEVVGSGSKVALPPCDGSRRLLAVDYARLHWGLKTSCKRDEVDGWWLVQVEVSPASRMPSLLLSVAPSGPGAGPNIETHPRLRFSGVKGAGDEVYDLLANDGLLGVRPGFSDGEVVAFLERGASSNAACKRLTGQTPGSEPLPVRSGAWGGQTGLRVVLENTLTGARVPGPAASNASASRQSPWKDTKNSLPDSWDD